MDDQLLPHDAEQFVTVVTGLPRSGTSLMMRMLQVGGMPVLADGLRRADVDNPHGYYEFEPVKRTAADPSWLAAAEGHAVKMVYRLLADLPAGYVYRVLLMRRRMDEVLASQRAMLARLGTPDDAAQDASLAEWFAGDLARLQQWAQSRDDVTMAEVDYNRLVSAGDDSLDRVSQFLGGRLDTDAMRAVIDPALYRQRG
jgi:hypothetical protein